MIEVIISGAAALFLSLLAAAFLFRQRTVSGSIFSLVMFVLACIEVLDSLILHTPAGPERFFNAAVFLESLLPAVFLAVSFSYGRAWNCKSIPLFWMILFGGTIIFPALLFLYPINDFFYSPDLQSDRLLFLGNLGYWFYMGIMVYCVLTLMNLEATFASAKGGDRWKIKFEIIGMGSIVAVLIFYYSQGLLYRTINMNLIPVRAGVIIISSALFAYSKLFRGSNVRISVSRFIIYRSLTLVMVGCYLLILGLIGEGMRYLGVNFSRDLTIFVAFTSGIVILLIVLSERLRRRVMVFFSKHFFRHKYDYRVEWLRFTERLALCRGLGEVNEAILTTFQETFGLKGVSLYVLDRQGQKFYLAASHNLPGKKVELRTGTPMLSYLLEKSRVFSTTDDMGVYAPNPEEMRFVSDSGARQIVPLIESNAIEGFVALGEQLAHDQYSFEDYDLMQAFARQSVLALMNVKLSEELSETREIAAVARISSFVVHDLKNLASSLSLLLSNANEYINEPEFQTDMIETVRNTVGKMEVLMQKLKKIPEKPKLSSELADIDLIARETLGVIGRTRPGAEIFYQGSPVTAVVDGEEFGKVILNLVLNALEASAPNGQVRVETGKNGKNLFIKVRDLGSGMTEEFIKNSLFKPFKTTKQKGLGIGLYQCKQIIEAHSGRIEVESKVGEGSLFTVYLPLPDNAQ
ncbi:Sensor histidine kinase, GAF domain-containing [Candidatus Sulfobium mesophilum]|uniref:histidine kinase n=1 Tax=Candidatus Sulfobium mesophilum TaxID=2016548 RepID=A0A2U3QDN8_9BACT|nr:Sensor histidine kinase, GAF domain-containing [Candidatus Sulfobium mesophilum]